MSDEGGFGTAGAAAAAPAPPAAVVPVEVVVDSARRRIDCHMLTPPLVPWLLLLPPTL
jgi:hypothetical protein